MLPKMTMVVEAQFKVRNESLGTHTCEEQFEIYVTNCVYLRPPASWQERTFDLLYGSRPLVYSDRVLFSWPNACPPCPDPYWYEWLTSRHPYWYEWLTSSDKRYLVFRDEDSSSSPSEVSLAIFHLLPKATEYEVLPVKHIDIWYHLLRDIVQKGEVVLDHIPTDCR